jgi:hypothetical protein
MKKFEVKKIITESVIGFLNGIKLVDDFDISDEDKKRIEEVVKNTLNRKGLLAFTYRIDPTAKGDWVLSKEELLYEMPIKYNYKLHEFVKNLRKQIENKK